MKLVQEGDKQLIEAESIGKHDGCVDRCLNGHDHSTREDARVLLAEEKADRLQETGQSLDKPIVRVDDCSVDVKTQRPDAIDIER
jgi:hypothetical protein